MIDELPEEFTDKDEELRNELISQGWASWTKKDFAKFLRACEIYGINDYENISKLLRNKTPINVENYVKVFLERIIELPNGQRLLTRINRFESEKNKNIEFQEILENIFNEVSDKYEDIYSHLLIPYKAKTKIPDK
jgi:SWI/SNF-related matrix-associated actin-dependent regulator of chromatin subfamily A member 5